MIGASMRTDRAPFLVCTANMSSSVCMGVSAMFIFSASPSLPRQEINRTASAAALAILKNLFPDLITYFWVRTVVVALMPLQLTV